jgi:hypothetical protein
MIGDAKFPAVGQIDRDHFAGPEAGGHESAGGVFNKFSIVPVTDTAIAGGIDDGGLFGRAPAGCQNRIVEEATSGIGVKLGTQHFGRIVAESGGRAGAPRQDRSAG